MGQPSPSVVMGMALASAMEIEFPDLTSGPPSGCRSEAMSVAMLRAMMEGESDLPPMWVWKASLSGQFFFFEAA